MVPLSRLGLAFTVLAAIGLAGCSEPARGPAGDADTPWFEDRAEASGLRFEHFDGMSGERYFVEVFAPGCALFDYDGDGDLDAYLVQGGMLGPGKTLDDATFPPAPDRKLVDRLFRNELVETGELRFTDVTADSGIAAEEYGMGVAAGDYDADGLPDLYVTAFGPNRLLRNRGDGTFEDVTAAAGAQDERWSSSAAFVDYDADGRLDLYVVNYVRVDLSDHRPCRAASGAPEYCGPNSYAPVADRLLRNLGDGTFEDRSAAAGIGRTTAAGLGIVTTDVDNDGRTDLYVANDGMPNQLWINLGNGTFREDALLAGCAFNEDGEAEASMGIDAADFDDDGDEDLFMSHLDNETNTLYVNDGRGRFDDRSFETGLGFASRPFTGFGAAWVDYDNDSLLDLFVVNGAVKSLEHLTLQRDPFPLHQTNQIFRNLGDGRFADVTAEAGPALALSEVSRGAAFGDVDNDGDVDVLIANNAGPARLLINAAAKRNRWIGLRLREDETRCDAVGARVEIDLADGRTLLRRVRRTASYLSSNDPRILVGLGAQATAEVVRVRWPDGLEESWPAPPPGAYATLLRGTGSAE
ncbi:MAG: CRTAC1 family protein [bacterium]|nr:CRTAC1 family protein [bacterium]